jgi:hypothetical protein
MKSAIDVIAKVQRVRVPAFIVTSSISNCSDLVTDYSPSGEKREATS